MRTSTVRRLVVTLTLLGGPVAGVVAWAAPAAGPAPVATNFVCASVGQVGVGLCIGPPLETPRL